SVGRGERTGDGAQGWFTLALATSVLVLRAPRGVHRDSAWNGRGFAVAFDLLAQADLRLQGDGVCDHGHRVLGIHGLGPSYVYEWHEPVHGLCFFAHDHGHWRSFGD